MPEGPTIARQHVKDTDVDVFTAHYPVPGLGLIPINAFLLRSPQPVLVDSGAIFLRDAYLAAFREAIDLTELRWLYLTHVDADHVGSVAAVLEAAPRLRVVTTFLGLGKLGLHMSITPERVYLLNPGQGLDIGDRELLALKPPTFDAPETTAFVDSRTRVLFSSDCFGAVLGAPVERAEQIPARALRDGLVTWATIDAPWLAAVEPAAFERSLAQLRDLGSRVVLSSHLPPAVGLTGRLLEHLESARRATPFVGPDQKAMTAMLASKGGG